MNQTFRQSPIVTIAKGPVVQSLSSTLLYLLQLYALPLFILLAVAVASVYADIPVGNFTRDPSAIVELHSYEGAISNLGALTWCAGATVCLFAGFLLRANQRTRDSSHFLLLAGAFTSILMLDDLFLGHEKLEAIGIPEQVTYASYMIFWLAVAYRFRVIILRNNFALLFVSVLFFGYSIGSDMAEGLIQRLIGEWRVFLEDGGKFLGIVGWFGYFAHLSYSEIRKAFH